MLKILGFSSDPSNDDVDITHAWLRPQTWRNRL